MTSDAPPAVLVVDDNDAKRFALVSALEPLGHRIIEASSGVEALRAVMQDTFAVILMDVQMPDMDGFETTKLIRMRRASEQTPIIFVTAHRSEEMKIPDAYASGAVDFIFAPVVPSILRAKVTIFVELRHKSRALEQTVAQFRDSEARVQSVLDSVADGIITLGSDEVIESVNRSASVLFGYTPSEVVGMPFCTLCGPNYSAQRGPKRAGRPIESVGCRKDGSTFPMELDLSDVVLATGVIRIACVRDISERQSYTQTLQHQALHDGLTGLPNRVLFGDRVKLALRAARRSGESLALLVMDLNDFKGVNDTLGHQQGDQLLQLVAERLSGCMREVDTIARLGGDEFAVLPAGNIDVAGVATVVWKIQQALEPTAHLGGHALEVSASIGIALAPGHGDNIDDLLRRADLAMYEAKRSGSGYALFAEEQEAVPARRLTLLGDLRTCIERDELVLHYQPQIDLVTRETIGVEALVRWNHPSRGLLMPGEFIPEVERSELMIPITQWVLDAALRQLRTWRDAGFDLTMAVNVGARCLARDATFFLSAREAAARWGISPDKLTFELTESALIDTTVPGFLAELQKLDARLSIDDFGTGYSSLVYLQRLPITEIKADRSFVMTMCSVAGDAVIVRSTIDLAHNLGVKVVAEGVEDEATLALLDDYGCDVAQGYYFSRPLTGEDLAAWLDSSPFGLPRRLDVAKSRVSDPAHLPSSV
jgi:diguanylate cyclase (GGDEF)-like protein/PAS domain S-box-containing protein